MRKGKTFIIAGPSGVGKGTIIKKLFERRKRPVFLRLRHHPLSRPGEMDGVDYHFSAGSDSWSGSTATRSWNTRSLWEISTGRQRNMWTRPWTAAGM